MKQQQTGFTLIELIVVIVILGILAATALPRFVNLAGDARAAQMQGIAASMEAAKQLVQARWLAAGSGGATTVDIGGAVIVSVLQGLAGAASVRNGLPTAAVGGMGAAIIVPPAVTCAGTPFVCTYTGFVGCTTTYDDSLGTGPVTVAAAAGTC